jgi:outer membrane protein OmpA-like peptidoglycan-associated protein/nitrogen fixation protein FixH
MKEKIIRFIIIWNVFLFSTDSQSKILNVPDTYKTIQSALNDAQKGDSITVREGIYKESIQWPATSEIQLIGEMDNTIINAQKKGSVIYFSGNLKGLIDAKTIIQGFILINGKPDNNQSNLYGGGLYCHSVSPHLKDLAIIDNVAHKGAGIYCFQSDLQLTNVTISNNQAMSGGGMACEYANPVLFNVTLSKNKANSGAAIYSVLSTLKLHNVSILKNITSKPNNNHCSALYLNSSRFILEYSLVWNSGIPQEVYFSEYDQENVLTIQDSDIRANDTLIITNNNGQVIRSMSQLTATPSHSVNKMYLSPESDSGIDPSDNITNINSIKLLAKGVHGNGMDIYVKGNPTPLTHTSLSDDIFTADIFLSEGSHHIYAHPVGALYTISSLPHPITITVDQTAPVIKSLSVTQISENEIIWTFITDDIDQKLSYKYCIDRKANPEPSQSYSTSQSASIKKPDLNDGVWYIHVKATDRAGNESQFFTFNTIVDNTPPEIQIKNISESHLVQKWTWFSVENEADISYRHLLDQLPHSIPTGDFNAMTQTTLSNVNGQWFLHVQAKDRFGNVSEVVTTSGQMDCIPPQINGLSNDLIPKKEKTWKWHSSETGTSFRFKINQKPKTVLKGKFTSDNQAKITGLNGKYYLHVQAKDSAGNISDVISVSALLDNTIAEIKGLSNDPVPRKSKTWTWQSSEAETTYRFLINQKNKAQLTGPFTKQNSASIANKDGKYFLHVQAKDAAQNLSQITTVYCILDNTSPVVTNLYDSPKHTKSKIWKWSARDTDSLLRFRYSIDQNKTATLSSKFTKITTASIKDKDGQWYLHVQARDRAGNMSEIKTVFAFLDNTPPILTLKNGLSNDFIPKKEKTWEWHSNESKTSFRYKINQKPKTVLKGKFKTDNQAKITGLNGKYYLHVQAKDSAGNISDVISVSALLDNTIAEIKGLSNDPIPRKSKTWTWQSSEAETTYRFLINQKAKTQLTGPFLNKTSASIANKDGKYFLHIQSKDAAKNLSQITTVYCILDNTSPVVTNLYDSPKHTKSKSWKWSARDADSLLRFRYSINQKKAVRLSNKFKKITTASIKDKDGRWYLHVQARDRAGNMSNIKTVSVLLDNTPPVLTLKAPDKSKRTIWRWLATDADKEIVYSYRCDRKDTFSPKYFYTSRMSFEPIDCLFNAPKDEKQLKDLNGRWFFHVSARDRTYNTAKKSKAFTFDFTHEGLYANLSISFKPNSTVMKSNSTGKLHKLSEIMKKFPDAIAIIEAHTDNVGDETYNLELSEKRAESIKQYLHKTLFISESRLECKGYGETRPIADNNTKKGRSLNRRAEVLLKSNNSKKTND